MKIFAAQGSPRPKVSNTEVLLQEFLSGARSAGAETETVYLQEKKIHPCTGCFSCWVKTPGVCIFKDDMPELLGKVRECDILVYAFPLYNYNMTAVMKAFQERLLPLSQPHFVKTGDVYRHPPRYAMNRRMVLISNCGFPEVSHFDGIRHVFRHMEKSSGAPLIGELLAPAGQLLRVEPLREKTRPILEAARRAGVEVVRDGRVAKETEAQIQKAIFTADQLAEMANKTWDHMLQELKKG